MNTFSSFLTCLEAEKTPFRETFYNFNTVFEKLRTLDDRYFAAQSFSITPFYFENGHIYEYYEYELVTEIVPILNFEKYVLRKTQYSRIGDIPKDIFLRTRACYIGIAVEKPVIRVDRLIRYIDFLFHAKPIVEQAISAFGSFSQRNLIFTVFFE